MFSKVMVYTLREDVITQVRNAIKDANVTFEKFKFTQCTEMQKKSVGFVPTPLGNFVDENNGDIFLTFCSQKKAPNRWDIQQTLDRKVDNWKAGIIEQEVNKGSCVEAMMGLDLTPNKKIIKEFKSEAEVEVLQRTYPTEPKTQQMIIKPNGVLIVEGNPNGAEEAIGLVRKVLGSFPAIPREFEGSVGDLLDSFVSEEINETITLGNKALFVTPEERKVQVSGESVYGSEAQDFVKKDGMMTTAVEIQYDGMISCLMRDSMTFDAIKFSEELTEDFEEADTAGTFLVCASELSKLVEDIYGRLTEA
ncbi:hypothetical protein KUA24_121 [Vibrio phage HNL01]|nr:hypothetical protein KUA24_121 [Vibrio phage HNL01]